MGRGVATPMNLGGTAGVRPRGPHLNWWHRAKATKVPCLWQTTEAEVPPGTSVARHVPHDQRLSELATRSRKVASAKRRQRVGPGLLGECVWKGHAV